MWIPSDMDLFHSQHGCNQGGKDSLTKFGTLPLYWVALQQHGIFAIGKQTRMGRVSERLFRSRCQKTFSIIVTCPQIFPKMSYCAVCSFSHGLYSHTTSAFRVRRCANLYLLVRAHSDFVKLFKIYPQSAEIMSSYNKWRITLLIVTVIQVSAKRSSHDISIHEPFVWSQSMHACVNRLTWLILTRSV